MSRFGIAGLQLALDVQDNLALIETEVESVCRRLPWVRLVLLGELSVFGVSLARAQVLPGEAEGRLCALAKRFGIWLVPGSLYERREEQIFNTAPVIDPSGKVVTRCRKLFPFMPYERGVAAGSEVCVFEVPDVGTFGVSICYDMWFPETTRSLCCLGAEVILHPTMTYTIDRDVELAIARASAATNQCYFVDINVAGKLGNGRSLVCGPGGEVICQAGSGRDVLAFEVDFDYVRGTREQGWHRLGQQLKSFRDSKLVYPAYGAGAVHSPALQKYGPLQLPEPVTSKPRDR